MDYRGFQEWEELITSNYQMLFTRPTPEQEQKVKIDTRNKIPEELNWIALVNKLANDDITKHKVIYKLNYKMCLTQLAWWHHRDLYQNGVQKQIERSRGKN